MMISPFALEGKEVFTGNRKEIRTGQTRGSASTRVVSEMIKIVMTMTMMMTMIIMMAMMMMMIGTCERVAGICRSLVDSSQQTLRPAILPLEFKYLTVTNIGIQIFDKDKH